MDGFFEIVPLDARYPDALKQSPIGEAVFPEGDEAIRGTYAPRPGEHVLINNAGRRLEQFPGSDELARIVQDILRRDPRMKRADS